MSAFDPSVVIIALASGTTGIGGAWFVLRGKKVEIVQHGTEWLVDQLRKDAEEARKDAEEARHDAREARDLLVEWQEARARDAEKIMHLESEICKLKAALQELTRIDDKKPPTV